MALMRLLSITILILTLHPNTAESHWFPYKPPPVVLPLPLPERGRPLCASQLVLVNRACAVLPYIAVHPPPSPSPEPDCDHRHHRPQRQGHVETPVEQECCRWLKVMDAECVCNLLVHLPPFMIHPGHEYKVVADETCQINFKCGPTS